MKNTNIKTQNNGISDCQALLRFFIWEVLVRNRFSFIVYTVQNKNKLNILTLLITIRISLFRITFTIKIYSTSPKLVFPALPQICFQPFQYGQNLALFSVVNESVAKMFIRLRVYGKIILEHGFVIKHL